MWSGLAEWHACPPESEYRGDQGAFSSNPISFISISVFSPFISSFFSLSHFPSWQMAVRVCEHINTVGLTQRELNKGEIPREAVSSSSISSILLTSGTVLPAFRKSFSRAVVPTNLRVCTDQL